MNKWRKRARKWRKEADSYKGYYIDTDLVLKTERLQNALLTERVNTELARVQGVCDELSVDEAEAVNQLEATRQQVRKHAATMLVIVGEYYQERNVLLAWQRRVREAWAAYDAEDEVEASTLDRLRQAVEAEAEPKEER
jgi:hypothetical protein